MNDGVKAWWPGGVTLCAVALAAMMPLAAAQGPPAVTPAAAQETAPQSFDDFVAGLRTEALSRGISQATIDAALTGLVAPQPVVVSRDRTQPELTQSLDAYLKQRLLPRTITTARQMLDRHGALLKKIEATYGVPPQIMIAIWGVESNFGRFTGSYPTIQALATLAYDNRRPLFRSELFHALAIVDQGVLAPGDLKGSWAGAMGQPQFMPSSYLKHAVDFDGDKRADIWTSQADVFASMANYLKNAGWTAGERWGREVKISRTVLDRIERTVTMRSGTCRAIREMTAAQPLSTWRKLGVTLATGALPNIAMEASLVRGQNRHFLVYKNFDALIDYNCSNSYAVTVALLSDRIAAR